MTDILPPAPDHHDLPPETAMAALAQIRAELGRHIIGQARVIDQTLTGIISGGHVLLMGLPGLAKTKLVESMGIVLGLASKRVQCTPDLMPADILGSEVLEQDEHGKRHFRFIPGPVFTQLLLVDEINRAAPRTQSAFLQAMQEGHVTVSGLSRALPRPFHVLATQNPIEHEGTYPLPEAQLDRFLLQVTIDYPDRTSERDILRATTSAPTAAPQTIIDGDTLRHIQSLVTRLPIGEQVVEGILTLIRRLRPDADGLPDVVKYLDWAPGIRASQALSLCARARALIDGRLTPSMEDVLALAPAVIAHRARLNYRAQADGITMADILAKAGAGL